MAIIRKAPGDPWRQPSRGDEVVLLPGIHAPFSMSGIPDVTIRGGEGVSVRGSMSSGGGDPATIRVNDGAHRLKILGPIELRDSRGRGLWVTVADDAIVRNLTTHGHQIEGALFGNCQRLTVEDYEAYDCTGDDRSHGLYVSGNASGSVIRRIKIRNCSGSGFQANGHGLGYHIEQLLLEEGDFQWCGSEGTPTLSLMSVSRSIFQKFRIQNSPVDWWVVLFSDGGGSDWACYDNTFRDYTVPDNSEDAIHEEDGSSGNQFIPGAGWSPGNGPQPPDPPRPPVDPKPAILADAQKQSAAIRAALENATARRIRAAAKVPLNLLDADLAALSR